MHKSSFLRLKLLLISITAIVASCKNAEQPIVVLDKKKEIATIHSIMAEQELTWNRADLEGFMQPYWKSDSLKFIGKRGITYGWQSTLNNYKNNYSTPDEMGKLKFTNITTDVLNDSAAFVIGKWQLFRTADTLAGYYTLLWKKVDARWIIIADHSS